MRGLCDNTEGKKRKEKERREKGGKQRNREGEKEIKDMFHNHLISSLSPIRLILALLLSIL